jgi:hypothetical protein
MECKCYVKNLSEHERFSVRRGAHEPTCPTYRESRDYAVDFTLTIAETVTVTAPSMEEAQEIVNDLGWWQLSGGNWEILEQHEKIEDGAVWRAKVQEKLESEAQRIEEEE